MATASSSSAKSEGLQQSETVLLLACFRIHNITLTAIQPTEQNKITKWKSTTTKPELAPRPDVEPFTDEETDWTEKKWRHSSEMVQREHRDTYGNGKGGLVAMIGS